MPGDRRAAETRLEALEEGLGQRDLRQKDQRLTTLAQAFGDRFEIDFGLTRSGNAVEQYRVEPPTARRGEAGGRVALVLVEIGGRVLGIGTGERPVGVDREGLESSGMDETAHDPVADLRVAGELADRALPPLDCRERLLPLRGQAIGHQARRPVFGQLARAFERRR